MRYAIFKVGPSRSFPEGDAFLRGASSADAAEIVLYSGTAVKPDPGKAAILVELGHECLAAHIDDEGSASFNIVGFARYRNGDDAPSRLVELVRHSNGGDSAIAAARQLFETAGFKVVVCGDQVGRIVSRLVVPKYNAALRFLDEGLATRSDMDLTCKAGLGYPDGPIERVLRGGLANYYELSKSLFDAYGTPAYVPARRAAVAFKRGSTSTSKGDR
jgi:3-hydroxybutyryl-CoA dehydrogenase